MSRRAVLALLAGVSLLLLWWFFMGRGRLTRAETAAVQHWLECEDCQANELATAVAIGSRAVSVFGTTLIDGPRAGRIFQVRRFLIRSYQSLAAYQSGLQIPLTTTQGQYLDRFL